MGGNAAGGITANTFVVEEEFSASKEAIFSVLIDENAVWPASSSVKPLTPGPVTTGSRWSIQPMRALFLREEMAVEVLEFVPPERYCIALHDGFNFVKYAFDLESLPTGGTLVRCRVDCHTIIAEGWAGPSEKLARMLEKHEGPLLERLRGRISKGNSHRLEAPRSIRTIGSSQ